MSRSSQTPLPREVVVDRQRERLLAGAAGALAEHGYAAMSVEHVLRRTRVSRAAFYANFENKRECVLAAHEMAFAHLSSELFRACAAEREWPAKVAAAVAASISYAVRAPQEAQLLVVEALAADQHLATRALSFNDFLVGLLRNGREQSARARALPDLTERALVGAATSVVGARLLAGEETLLADLTPQLVQFFLMPYVGPEEARGVARAGR